MGLIAAVPHGPWDLVGYVLCLAVGLLGYETLVVVLPVVIAVAGMLWRFHAHPPEGFLWVLAAMFLVFLSLLQYMVCMGMAMLPWLLLHADKIDRFEVRWKIPLRPRPPDAEAPRARGVSMGSWEDPSERKPPGGV